jgi:hypothetical protein
MVLVGKPEGNRLLAIPRRRLEDRIKKDLGEKLWGYVDWVHLVQDKGQLEGSCELGNERSNFIECWELLEWQNNWRLSKNGLAPWKLLVQLELLRPLFDPGSN